MNHRQKRVAALIAALCLQAVSPIGWTETIPETTAEVVQTAESPSTQPPETSESQPTAAPPEKAEATAAPEPIETPTETVFPEPSESPEKTASPEPSESPEETFSPEPSESPEEMFSPEPSESPEETPSPEPDETPEETASPEPSESPEPTEIPEEEEDQLPEDPSESEPPLETPKRDNSIGWKGVVQTDEKGMAIPMLFQGDYRTVVCYFDGTARSVASSGCGAASMSMVIAYLTGNTEQNPYRLFCQAVDEGRYHGNGLSHATLSHFAREYGVHSHWISNDAEAILEALQAGKPVVAHMGKGIFTSRGHYIVLRGVTEDGLILVNDPASRSNCSKAFPIETLLREARTSTSFMVCWVDDKASVTSETAEETLWGDINGSGRVDMNDVQIIYDVCNGKWTDGALLARCDLNEDGAIDILDVQTLANYVRTGAIGVDP